MLRAAYWSAIPLPLPSLKHLRASPSAFEQRRALLLALAAQFAASLLAHSAAVAQARPIITRPVPSSGVALPVVGLGSWITFNVGNDRGARDMCAEVMRNFFAAGGRLIDSSPMYGSAQEVIGYGLSKFDKIMGQVFAADKVWISSAARGPGQIETSRQHWNVPHFDLLQVHNLLSWQEHLPMLLAMKAARRVRYVGITTSEGRRHREFEQVMASQPLDFVQVTYNIVDREVEQRILPLALDRRIGVLINRPFRQGELIRTLNRHPLPGWVAEIDCTNWAQFLLKFIVSHPAVTCAIPATSSVAHVLENMGAAYGRLPDEPMRRRMVAYVEKL
ncbi:MAG: aldo/keto reductase [Pseudomonadota bacterium]|nr:aldo/keto reductase [Pseudomonadota bacterium]